MKFNKISAGYYMTPDEKYIVNRVLYVSYPEWRLLQQAPDGTNYDWCQSFNTKREAIEAAKLCEAEAN